MTLASLFDGSGGFPLAGILAGMEPKWASEIEPFPIRVTTKRLPEMEHLGDVSKIDGGKVEPVDVITFGSPCFPAGTLVLTDKGYVEIEDVEVGDMVLTHEGRYRKVTATGRKEAETIVLTDGTRELECTPNHPIYSLGKVAEWVPAEDMRGRLWATPNEIDDGGECELRDDLHAWRRVTDIKATHEIKTVYNMTVEEDNSYVADGIVVHNCQDMSLAGRHAGLEGSRSGLFFEAIRIIKEMREATDGRYPKYAVWENVPGAFSSNGGEDFRAVLEAFARVAGAEVDMPRPERWEHSGYILGDGFSVAWRLLDAQFWGVPQRRKRIFLVADFGGGRAPKILFESEGLSRYSAKSFGAWKEFARDPEGGFGEAVDTYRINYFHTAATNNISPTIEAGVYKAPELATVPEAHVNLEYHPADSRVKIEDDDVAQTLSSRMGTGGDNVPLVMTGDEIPFHANTRDELINLKGVAGSLLATRSDRMQTYLACLNDQGGGEMAVTDDMTGTLRAETHGHPPIVLNDQGGERMDITDDVTVTHRAQSMHPPAVMEESYSIQGSTIGRKLENGANGKGVNEEVSFTLNTIDRHAVCTASGEERELPPLAYGMGAELYQQGKFMPGIGEEVAPTMAARHEGLVEQQYAVRSLTPTECARLQGFPDWWCSNLGTENPSDEDMAFWRKVWDTWCDCNDMKRKTDSQIKRWLKDPYSEASEYKMWGNGVALPCVWFVLAGIVWAEEG